MHGRGAVSGFGTVLARSRPEIMIRMVTKLESALESILLIMSGVAQPGSAPALGAD